MQNKPLKYYSVYLRKGDRPIYIHGRPVECAKAMRLKNVADFYKIYNRSRKMGEHCKYEIIEDEE